ncbi:MAG: universal stress protein [Ardenticatenaceae bacterium]|nr:universal stress protein [Ardenticatenaceae bacterium]
MSELSELNYQIAVRDFQRARKEAAMQQMLARIQGRSADLLCYDEVRRQLRATGKPIERGLQEIPLAKIVGSVGRYQDFTRSFLPKKDSNEERWARVKAAITDMRGMPPIEVYQVGDAYFVKDGNHRVSVARQLGSETISAYVTEVETRVPLTAADDPDEVICKARYADFLEKTNLDKLLPEANLLMTFCGHYQTLLNQIQAECCLLGDSPACEGLDWETAVVAWYNEVYLPVVKLIRELGVMRRFPERTEADIYVLLSEEREELQDALQWRLDAKTAVSTILKPPTRPLLNRLLDAVAPDLEEGPRPGRWRQQQLALHREGHLFENILVLLEGIEGDWRILNRVIRWAQMDNDHILGLHVVREKSQKNSEAVQALRAEFERRCQEAGVDGEFAIEVGGTTNAIIKRAAWVDLVVINLTHPPEAQPLARIGPGWGRLIQRCPRPLLVLPDAVETPLSHALLAYDGSAKADEALFLATYFAVRWRMALTVLTVQTQYTHTTAIEQARAYLEKHGVTAVEYVLDEEPIAEAILRTADQRSCNFLIMGGFGHRPMMRVMLGSTVEHMLREFKWPMLICR